MTHLELAILNYLLNALWQIPVIFLVATLAARFTRSAGPQIEHRIWVTALILEVILPACAFAPALRNLFFSLFQRDSGHITTQTTILNATAAQSHSHLAATIGSIAFLVYMALLLYFAARLLYRLHRTRALAHTSQPIILTGELLMTWLRCIRIFDVHGSQIATSAQIAGPSTIGIRRRIILFPPALLTSLAHEDLTAALAHEFAHMRRRDFAKNLLYELIALPIAWHPLLWLTRHRTTETREMVCDELAAEATHGTTRYAHSLLRLAKSFSRTRPAATLHTIGILDANILERRVMKLTRNHSITPASRRAAIVAAIALGVATCASALSLRLELPAPAAIATPGHQQQPDGHMKVAGSVLAGQVVSRVNPIYPPEAREKGIEGMVVLHATVGKDGTIQDLAVMSGPEELQSSAVDAVKQWVYKPYLLNGEPTEVETTITVNFSLANSPAQQSPSQPPVAIRTAGPDIPHSARGSDAGLNIIGGSIRPPVLIHDVHPEYPASARQAKLSGNVLVTFLVDQDGHPQNVHVTRGLGNELDEKAVEAVQQYRFKPATRDGEAVPANLHVEVNFRIF